MPTAASKYGTKRIYVTVRTEARYKTLCKRNPFYFVIKCNFREKWKVLNLLLPGTHRKNKLINLEKEKKHLPSQWKETIHVIKTKFHTLQRINNRKGSYWHSSVHLDFLMMFILRHRSDLYNFIFVKWSTELYLIAFDFSVT